MAQKQQKQETIQQRWQQADEILNQRLQRSGYTQQEAQEIVRIAHTLVGRRNRPNQPPDLNAANPLHRRISETDLSSTARALVGVYNQRDRRVGEILAGDPMYGGPTQAIAVREAPRPAPVRTYNYSFTLTDAQGRTTSYEVTLNRDPRSIGSGNLAERFYAMAREAPGAAIAVTRGDTTVSADEFWRNYRSVYRDVQTTTGTQASIDIHGIRHSRG
ncbi:MAG TPA: hypothetical protein VLD37_06105 [Candidatus Bilamarchaeum sp.]|nr:hypothetical protein [Candidatus Bilamarchaeum sp.]